MRCTTARKIMIASLDGAARDDEQRRLADHLAGCMACRHEHEQARRLARAIEGLDSEAAVPASLEDAVMRRVRSLEDERPTVIERLRAWLPPPVVLASAAVATAVLVFNVGDHGAGPAGSGPIARPRPVQARATRVATAAVKSRAAVSEPPVEADAPVQLASAAGEAPPSDPPPDLTASLPLLLDMPILRHMEKLENFERIESLTLIDDGGTNG